MDTILGFGFAVAFFITLIFVINVFRFLTCLSKDAHSFFSDQFKLTAEFVALWPIPSLLINIFAGYFVISRTNFYSTDKLNIAISVLMLVSLVATYLLSLAYIRNHPDEIEAYKKYMERRNKG